MTKRESNKPKRRGVPKRRLVYAKVAKHAPKAIEVLVYLMEFAKQESVKIAAAKTLLAKTIPDIKALELSSDSDKPLGVVILPQLRKVRSVAKSALYDKKKTDSKEQPKDKQSDDRHKEAK